MYHPQASLVHMLPSVPPRLGLLHNPLTTPDIIHHIPHGHCLCSILRLSGKARIVGSDVALIPASLFNALPFLFPGHQVIADLAPADAFS